MIYLQAFILGGLIALILQAFQQITKMSFVVLMISAIFLGTILTATGIMPILTSWGGAGILLTVVDLGEGFYNGIMAALSGTFAPIITILIIIVCLFIFGLLSALLELNVHRTPLVLQSDKGAKAN
ncbi:MAG: SpoVA/SpoVAEb family sporulation membrane protein [Thermacetogeniaceae bacterium]|jgi:hypothetical protein|nr:SpoVA/SpoVAEb family sporulation membrane protein [Syntrophomonadaceae bacterium]